MRDLFTLETAQIGQAKDLVQWTLDDRKVRIYYPTCIALSAQIRVYAKAAVTAAGGNTRLWRELAKYDQEPSMVPLHRKYRRSGHLSNLKSWNVKPDGELVVIYLDDLVAMFHCTDALIAQAMLLRAAKNAKRWAGDGSRQLMVTAVLHNATPG